jgi:spore germination cell wall hydrolase CwlJ-like protein
MLAFGSTGASAQVATPVPAAAVSTPATAYQTATATPAGPSLSVPGTSTAVTPASNGAIAMTVPAHTVTIALPAPSGTPTLAQLVEAEKVGPLLDEQGNCLATAVYFESRGESLEGQLAVAQVVMNRAASGQYPASWCEVVKQKAQFSFVHRGTWPPIRDIDCWRKAEAIARIAIANAAKVIPNDVLWYHADYVSPSWGSRLDEVEQIGAHIYYRAKSGLRRPIQHRPACFPSSGRSPDSAHR